MCVGFVVQVAVVVVQSKSRYPVAKTTIRCEINVQNSRFISTLASTQTSEEAQAFIKSIQSEFPDASHNCWAYVVGPPGSTVNVGCSDDGEPHGTAGRPMLNVLLHCELGDIAAVVTRYFGGTKLGRGGLVRAYGQAVQESLLSVESMLKIYWVDVELKLSYSDMAIIERALAEFGAQKIDEQFRDLIYMNVQVPEDKFDNFCVVVKDQTRGRVLVDNS